MNNKTKERKTMRRHEIVSFITDDILTDPEVSAQDVISISNLANLNDNFYNLLLAWEKETDRNKRHKVYKKMLMHLYSIH